MTSRLRLIGLLGLLAASSALALPSAQEPTDRLTADQQPRFRSGANLVRLDAYVSADSVAVTDLTAQDFEILEDNVPQKVESFRLVTPRPPGAENERREPNNLAEARDMAAAPEARVFVVFMDLYHVRLQGAYRAQAPMTRLLDRLIGQDDLVGVMTPLMSARNLTLARRLTTIEVLFKDNWFWGARNRLRDDDPREYEIQACYPDANETRGIAAAMIARRREGRTLDAIEDLVIHLEGIREERKFVVLLTEGWRLYAPDQALARPVGGQAPGGRTPIGTDPEGRLRLDPDRGSGSYESCERERSMLAQANHVSKFQQLLQRANRANVSFYPLDARGMTAFVDPVPVDRRSVVAVDDHPWLRERHESMRTLALVTDGYAIVDTNAIDRGLDRMVRDAGPYYLLGYYSTNTKLDGKYRPLTVRVKRPGVDVRSRPGYQAPTEAEMSAAMGTTAAPGTRPITSGVTRALERLAPARGALPMRIDAAAGSRRIWITGELDAATFRNAEWQQGGRAHLVFEHSEGASAPVEADIELAPGQRAFSVAPDAQQALAPGRYVVRAQLTPKGGKLPLRASVDVVVPGEKALLGSSGRASRRGPTTGLQYQPTADARFQRTERLRVEVARLASDGTVSARMLGRDGQPLPLAVALSDREADAERLIVADLTLAPMAQGEYVLEIALEKDGTTERTTYGFRIVP